VEISFEDCRILRFFTLHWGTRWRMQILERYDQGGTAGCCCQMNHQAEIFVKKLHAQNVIQSENSQSSIGTHG